MRDHLERFGDAVVAVVTFATPERLAKYREYLRVPFFILSDTRRELYRLLGAGRGTARQVWTIGTLTMYVRLMRRGRRLHWPTEDINQLGADAVVGRDGRLRYLAVEASPDRRPSIDELVAALD